MPNVVTFIRYLVQRGDFRYILTGSLMALSSRGIDSPAGEGMSSRSRYPLDFEGFLLEQRRLLPERFDMLRVV